MAMKPTYEELEERVKKLEKVDTKRKQTEEELRGEMEFTETALDAQLDTFFLFEPATGKALRWNRSFIRISGYTDEEVARMPAPDSYYSPEDLERARAFIQEVLKEGTGTIELELICKDGRKVPYEYSVSAIKDEQGGPKYIISIGRDITERKRAEDELKESEERFRLLMEHSPLAMAVYDSDGLQVAANRAMETQWLIERTETLGKFNVLDSDFMREQGMLHYVQEAYTGRTVHTPEIEIDPRAAFGTSRPRVIHSHLYSLPGPEGSVAGIVVVDEDVTERK